MDSRLRSRTAERARHTKHREVGEVPCAPTIRRLSRDNLPDTMSLAYFILILVVQLCMTDHASYTRNLAAFYYGSLSRPSQDPARIGLLSTVPLNAGELLSDDVEFAKAQHHNLPSMLFSAPPCSGAVALTNRDSDIEEPPPASLPPLYATGIGGVPLASPVPDNASITKNGASSGVGVSPSVSWSALTSVVVLTLWKTVG